MTASRPSITTEQAETSIHALVEVLKRTDLGKLEEKALIGAVVRTIRNKRLKNKALAPINVKK